MAMGRGCGVVGWRAAYRLRINSVPIPHGYKFNLLNYKYKQIILLFDIAYSPLRQTEFKRNRYPVFTGSMSDFT